MKNNALNTTIIVLSVVLCIGGFLGYIENSSKLKADNIVLNLPYPIYNLGLLTNKKIDNFSNLDYSNNNFISSDKTNNAYIYENGMITYLGTGMPKSTIVTSQKVDNVRSVKYVNDINLGGLAIISKDNKLTLNEVNYNNDSISIKGSAIVSDNTFIASENNVFNSLFIKENNVIKKLIGINNNGEMIFDTTEKYEYKKLAYLDEKSNILIFNKDNQVKEVFNYYDGEDDKDSNIFYILNPDHEKIVAKLVFLYEYENDKENLMIVDVDNNMYILKSRYTNVVRKYNSKKFKNYIYIEENNLRYISIKYEDKKSDKFIIDSENKIIDLR